MKFKKHIQYNTCVYNPQSTAFDYIRPKQLNTNTHAYKHQSQQIHITQYYIYISHFPRKHWLNAYFSQYMQTISHPYIHRSSAQYTFRLKRTFVRCIISCAFPKYYTKKKHRNVWKIDKGKTTNSTVLVDILILCVKSKHLKLYTDTNRAKKKKTKKKKPYLIDFLLCK